MLLLLLIGCSDSTGPSVTGPLLLTAQLNGSLWNVDNPLAVSAYLTPEGYFYVTAFRPGTAERPPDALGVQVVEFGGPGRYVLTADPAQNFGGYAIYDTINRRDTLFVSSPPNVGAIDVAEVDTVSRRVAGRFSFEAQEIEGPRRITVTNGFFRAEYETSRP